MTERPTTSDSLAYIKMLLKHADAADYDDDGDKDGTVYKAVASAYADVMIARARKAGCTEEVKHLQLAKEVIGRLKKDLMEIPWGTWLQGMLNDRLSEKIEAAGGKELLQWYDTHAVDTCPKLDYTPPNLSAYKPKTPPTR